ncbi:hypothetical protein HPP92_017485 [Vanilla planifolia]|uniref:Uncharacterized protein n=1 Tax=Vanilla planifolia TaxID=51239 RepID=A0A835USA9_VANPL|nr:hypothetical protein HPP92_017485 [Vanilla planifolia]
MKVVSREERVIRVGMTEQVSQEISVMKMVATPTSSRARRGRGYEIRDLLRPWSSSRGGELFSKSPDHLPSTVSLHTTCGTPAYVARRSYARRIRRRKGRSLVLRRHPL